MKKYFILAVVLFLVTLPFTKIIFQSKKWANPHHYFFSVKNLPVDPDAAAKPQLELLKEDKYYTLQLEKDQQKYEGLFTVKNDQNGKLKFGGVFFKNKATEKFSMMDINLIENKNHYILEVKTQNGNGLFKTANSYKNKEEFPVSFEIRAHPETGRPTVVLSLKDIESGAKLYFKELSEPKEKDFLGKWQGFDNRRGDWVFEINQLTKFQVTGTAMMKVNDVLQCHYPVYGFIAHNSFMILTGESVSNPSDCPIKSWRVYKNEQNTVEFDDMQAEDYFTKFAVEKI